MGLWKVWLLSIFIFITEIVAEEYNSVYDTPNFFSNEELEKFIIKLYDASLEESAKLPPKKVNLKEGLPEFKGGAISTIIGNNLTDEKLNISSTYNEQKAVNISIKQKKKGIDTILSAKIAQSIRREDNVASQTPQNVTDDSPQNDINKDSESQTEPLSEEVVEEKTSSSSKISDSMLTAIEKLRSYRKKEKEKLGVYNWLSCNRTLFDHKNFTKEEGTPLWYLFSGPAVPVALRDMDHATTQYTYDYLQARSLMSHEMLDFMKGPYFNKREIHCDNCNSSVGLYCDVRESDHSEDYTVAASRVKYFPTAEYHPGNEVDE